VRAAGNDDAHRRIPRLEQRPAGMRQELRGHVGIGHPDAHVHLQGAEAEIEQRGAPILFAQRLFIRPERS